MEDFVRGYIDCALWAEGHDACEEGLLAEEALATMREDCADFWAANEADVQADPGRAGADFYLTRCRHGAGFWDGDWPADVGRRLTDASRPYGSQCLYEGDDGLLYLG